MAHTMIHNAKLIFSDFLMLQDEIPWHYVNIFHTKSIIPNIASCLDVVAWNVTFISYYIEYNLFRSFGLSFSFCLLRPPQVPNMVM